MYASFLSIFIYVIVQSAFYEFPVTQIRWQTECTIWLVFIEQKKPEETDISFSEFVYAETRIFTLAFEPFVRAFWRKILYAFSSGAYAPHVPFFVALGFVGVPKPPDRCEYYALVRHLRASFHHAQVQVAFGRTGVERRV
jgi:hypothetical protein